MYHMQRHKKTLKNAHHTPSMLFQLYNTHRDKSKPPHTLITTMRMAEWMIGRK